MFLQYLSYMFLLVVFVFFLIFLILVEKIKPDCFSNIDNHLIMLIDIQQTQIKKEHILQKFIKLFCFSGNHFKNISEKKLPLSDFIFKFYIK